MAGPFHRFQSRFFGEVPGDLNPMPLRGLQAYRPLMVSANGAAFKPCEMLSTPAHRAAYRANRYALASTLKNSCLTVFK